MNVTVNRSLHDFGDEVYINYTVDRINATQKPIAIDVYQSGHTMPLTFRCNNGSIDNLLRVFFKDICMDPIVIVNKTATVTLGLELDVKFTYMDMVCNHILIGPQSEYSCRICTEC